MCTQTALDVITQKFGWQRAAYRDGESNEQKSLNGFDPTIFIPSNWRGTYTPELAKVPNFVRYGGLVPVAPDWFQKNYMGVYSLKEQPTIEEPKAFTLPRFS